MSDDGAARDAGDPPADRDGAAGAAARADRPVPEVADVPPPVDFDVVVDLVVSRGAPSDGSPPDETPPAPMPRRPGELITVLSLGWRAADPMAVHLTVRSTPDHPALPRGSWVVLRDFLRYGLEEPTGDGAVRIQPGSHGHRVWIRLARAARPAWISAPCAVVRGFLDQTDELDPTGEQRSAEAIDAVIARLLER